jgi:hypothetical protein
MIAWNFVLPGLNVEAGYIIRQQKYETLKAATFNELEKMLLLVSAFKNHYSTMKKSIVLVALFCGSLSAFAQKAKVGLTTMAIYKVMYVMRTMIMMVFQMH